MSRIRIKVARELGELNLSYADLAAMADLREGTVGQYAKEITDRVSLTHFALMCDALECDVCDLLELESNEEYEEDLERRKRIATRKQEARDQRRRRHKNKKQQK